MPTAAVDFGTVLDSAAHVIRMALTPVFLLLSIAALLNVFSTRLGLVGDRVELVLKMLETASGDTATMLRDQLVHLRRRTLMLDGAVILAAVAKAAICAAVLLLFAGVLWGFELGMALLLAFGLAIVCALGAIVAFAVEMLVAGTGIRAELVQTTRRHHHVLHGPHRSSTGA